MSENTLYPVTWVISVTRADGTFLFSFTCPETQGRANYLAGVAVDTLADATGETFAYYVSAGGAFVSADAVAAFAHRACQPGFNPTEVSEVRG